MSLPPHLDVLATTANHGASKRSAGDTGRETTRLSGPVGLYLQLTGSMQLPHVQ